MAERQRLNIDFSKVFPGDTLVIGESSVSILPLGIKKLANIARQLKGFGKILTEDGISVENANEPENILKIATLLLDKFPEVLEEASNIALDDLEELPIDSIVEILAMVMEVNMKSKDNLEKNFKSLVEKLSLTPSKALPKKTTKGK